MKETLKITNVLNDGTRLNIYEYISQKHDVVNVQEIAERFGIHPNVARLHLTKLEDIGMVNSKLQKNQKGGRPYRIYQLSDEVVQLQFPFRDYETLAKIAIETLLSLGDPGKEALLETGKKYGKHILTTKYPRSKADTLTKTQKLDILRETSVMLGLHPEVNYNEGSNVVSIKIFNCPFKEIAFQDENQTICEMHRYFIRGMLEELYTDVTLKESNMLDGCQACMYKTTV
ncbi:helix-turn-helix transcriptional regulator [Salinibacillus xinjiangensis]|uniref:Transcriptional regulator n=1 Tax=Salinibacillus xinjiangensis TaxID=1229268 RepID=A0A6G1X6F0_9BACI|nr:helix-turn-helix domain-containing protein [Salinibacillus xinjiangensis]MRG86581.1 transcriptional regulator [Salinibacillus xinjiangensis]